MSKKAFSYLRAAVAAWAALSLARGSRASDCPPTIDETVITQVPYAAISGVQVSQTGDTLAVQIEYQLHSREDAEPVRAQLFVAVDQSIVATVYDGSPGVCPGAIGDWSNPSIAVLALAPGPHTVYAVHTAADTQAAGLDAYEHEGIGWRVEIGVFTVTELSRDENRPSARARNGGACPPETGGDADGDGVCGNQDAYPESDVRPTIVIQECDCEVANQMVGAGSTMADAIEVLFDEAQQAKDFTRGVARLASSWERASLITEAERVEIEECSKAAPFPVKEPKKTEPAALDPDTREGDSSTPHPPAPPEPPKPVPSLPTEPEPAPPMPDDASDAEEQGESADRGSESPGRDDRVTVFETLAETGPAPPGCGLGLTTPTIFSLAIIVSGRPRRRPE